MLNSEVLNRKFAEACVKGFTPSENIEQVIAKPPKKLHDFIDMYCTVPPFIEDVGARFGHMDDEDISDMDKALIVNMLAGRQIVRNFVASLIEDMDFEEVLFYINAKAKEQAHLKNEGVDEMPGNREDLLKMFAELKRIIDRNTRRPDEDVG